MRYPDLLIIGAMKSGTTGLYMDLCEHPHVFLAQDKEPHALCHDDVLSPAGSIRYAAIYSSAASHQLCIDASTGYSKRPDYEGVPARAAKLLPDGFKVVYVVRHPIERIISHHHHDFSRGEVERDINAAVRSHNRYLAYSRYAYQLKPWIDELGWDRIKVVTFEDYVSQRERVVAEVLHFLGLNELQTAANSDKVFNKSEGKPVLTPFWKSIHANPVYRGVLRRLLSVKLRSALREAILPKAPDRPEPPSKNTLEWIKQELRADIEEFQGFDEVPQLPWSDLASEMKFA